tara:strand:- start:5515 stop:5850 length:336 start_codon:yes stop_codon:yes gene_type:complete
MKSKKKQKGGASNSGIIVVAVVLLLVAGAIYAYYSLKSDKPIPYHKFNSDKLIEGLDTETDLDSLEENLFAPEPAKSYAVNNELADADKTIYNPNEPVDPSIPSNFGMQYI